MSEDQLLHIHTNFYRDFFMICVEIQVDGERLQLQGQSTNLVLHCPHLNCSISQQFLLECVNVGCLKYGVQRIARMKCGPDPLFELDFPTNRSLNVFLTASEHGEVQQHIQCEVTKYIGTCTLRPKPIVNPQVEVTTKLFLVSPNTATNDPVLRLVTLENCADCLDIFRKGKGFDFGALVRSYQENRSREAPDMTTLVNELKEVVNWITVGLNLRIPYYELRRIQKSHDHMDGLMEMLHVWLNSGSASWGCLVIALKKSGFGKLAKRIMITYGVPCLESSSCSHIIEEDSNDSVFITTQSCKVIEEQDNEAERLQESLKREAKKERKLSTTLHDVKESLEQVTERVCHLTSEHEQLCTTLEMRKKQHKALLKQKEQADELKDLVKEIEETIEKLTIQIIALESEMKKCNLKEVELKTELNFKEKELRNLSEAVCDLRTRNKELCHDLEAEKRVFEMHLRQMMAQKESDYALHRELKTQITFLRKELNYRHTEVVNLHQLLQDRNGYAQTTEELKVQVSLLLSELKQPSLKHTHPARVESEPILLYHPHPSSSSPTHTSYTRSTGHKRFNSTPTQVDKNSSPPPIPPRLKNTIGNSKEKRPYSSPSSPPLDTESKLGFQRSHSVDGPSNIRWYYKNLSEEDAERILTSNINYPAGTFLVRDKIHSCSLLQLGLSVLGRDQVYHLSIQRHGNLYFFSKDTTFSSLDRLISHYRSHGGSLPCPLTMPCVKLNHLEDWEVTAKSLFLHEPLEEGTYSYIHNGVLNKHKPVVVKRMKSDSPLSSLQFFTEAILLQDLQHNNIHQLTATARGEGSQGHLCIIMEAAVCLNLKEHLELNRSHLGFQSLLNMLVQIARGLAYLESKRCIHRNLAAKNIVLSPQNVAKISNFSRACYSPSGKMICKFKMNILLRWSAPELLFENTSSSKSDMWSFGITLWEILMYGEKPYGDLDKNSVKEIIKKGYRMPQPMQCPNKLYSLMLHCWQENPLNRPSCRILMESLGRIRDGVV